MKTAIIISGHMRTFDKCLPTLHWHVFRHYPGADFFVSTVTDADAPKARLLRGLYPEAKIEISEVEAQPDCVAELRALGVSLPAEWVKGKPYTHEPYAISVHPQAVLRQLWQLAHAWQVVGSRGKRDEYDQFIRVRPDLWFHSFKRPASLENETVAHVPYWGQFGGVNDRFAILGKQAAAAYFSTYANLPQLVAFGCPVHPESLVAASLELSGAWIRARLCAEFSTLRPNGELRTPEVTATDLARLYS